MKPHVTQSLVLHTHIDQLAAKKSLQLFFFVSFMAPLVPALMIFHSVTKLSLHPFLVLCSFVPGMKSFITLFIPPMHHQASSRADFLRDYFYWY